MENVSRIKYPRTPHLPWSNPDSDDERWEDCHRFDDKEVVVTSKMDGECTTIYPDGFVHARSVDSKHHASRSWIKSLAAGICHKIPRTMYICGENLFAWHSILYTELPTYFMVFGVYENGYCLSWSDVEDVADMLALPTVPVIWRGQWDEQYAKNFWTGKGAFPTFASKIDSAERQPEYPQDFEPCEAEGYVVRYAGTFPRSQFKDFVAKYVSGQFKQSMRDVHWASAPVVRNLLRKYEIKIQVNQLSQEDQDYLDSLR